MISDILLPRLLPSPVYLVDPNEQSVVWCCLLSPVAAIFMRSVVSTFKSQSLWTDNVDIIF